jgi:hypothetical protein
MKRNMLVLLTIFALAATGALVAQTSQTPQNPPAANTGVAPETEQGEGMDLDVDTGARAEDGLVDVEVNRTHDADTSAQGNDQGTRTGTTTGTMGTTTNRTGLANETERGTGVDVDVDTGNRANGAVDVDVNRTTDADTDASGVDETGSLDNDADGALPNTASDLPLVALIGLLCLGAAYSVRTLAKRDA